MQISILAEGVDRAGVLAKVQLGAAGLRVLVEGLARIRCCQGAGEQGDAQRTPGEGEKNGPGAGWLQ